MSGTARVYSSSDLASTNPTSVIEHQNMKSSEVPNVDQLAVHMSPSSFEIYSATLMLSIKYN